MANEPKRVSSHEKHGQGHERLVRRITARACIGLRSPHKRGAHDNGSTLQPVSGAVGASVLEDTMTVHRVALFPLLSCALRREHALEETRVGGQGGHALHGAQDCRGAMRCMGLTHTSGLWGHVLHGTRSHTILELQRKVGVWRWLAGVLRGVSRKAHTHLTTWLWLRLCHFALRHCLWDWSPASLHCCWCKGYANPSCCEPQEEHGPHKSAPLLL